MPDDRQVLFSRRRVGTKAASSPRRSRIATRPPGVFALNDRKWQANAYKRLKGKYRVRIKAPTASGKSLLMKVLSSFWLKKGKKCILTVPQKIIGQSLNRTVAGRKGVTIILPNGKRVEWQPTEVLIASTKTVGKLIAFLRSKKPGILLCTHATLVRAEKVLAAMPKGAAKLWRNVALFTDEGHHTLIDKKALNQLGRLLQWWAEKNPKAPLIMVSATWMRSDLGEMLPDVPFDCFEYRIEDYLDDMKYLREINIVLRSASPRAAIRRALCDGAKRLIIYQPMVNSRHSNGRTKNELLHEILAALGPWEQVGVYRVHTTTVNGVKRKLRSIDLVTDDKGRKHRQKALIESVDTRREPDVVICLCMGIEGYDQPSLDRAIVLGPRDALNQMAQILGRLLRDYKGKTSVQLDLVTNPDLVNNRDLYENFAETFVMALLLDWCLSPPRLNGKDVSEKNLQKVAEGLLNNPRALSEDPASLIRGLMSDILNVDRDDKELMELGNKLNIHYDKLLRESLDGTDIGLEFTGLRGLAEATCMKLTGQSFRMARIALKKGLDFTETEVERIIGSFIAANKTIPTVSTAGDISPKSPGVLWINLDQYCRAEFSKQLREKVAKVINDRRKRRRTMRAESHASPPA